MGSPVLPVWRDVKPILGMVHLRALPGSPRHDGDLEAVREAALADARALVDGGVDGLLVENFGDAPFHPGRVPAPVVAHLTALAAAVRREVDVPLGVNVLRNDAVAALGIAHAVGAEMIRVNVLCGARLTDQGIVQGVAHELLRERRSLGAENVRILADVNVKHSAPLAPYDLSQGVRDVLERGGADAVVVSGTGTGAAVDLAELKEVRAASQGAPVLVGSGVTAETAARTLEDADGLIVGTAFQRDGWSAAPVEPARVRELIRAARGAGG